MAEFGGLHRKLELLLNQFNVSCATFVIKTGTEVPGGMGGEGACTSRYTVTTRMISALRWAGTERALVGLGGAVLAAACSFPS